MANNPESSLTQLIELKKFRIKNIKCSLNQINKNWIIKVP